MAIECCGETRTTRFCPQCGVRLSEASVLDGLLEHCRAAERNARACASRMLRAEPDEGSSAFGEKLARRKLAIADKWKARGDALAAIMSSGGQ